MKKKGNDHRMAYIAGAVLTCLVLAFVIGWGYFKPLQEPAGTDVAFTTVGPLIIASHGYAFSATLAVQTTADDGDWAKKNVKKMTDALHQTLFDTDPAAMRDPSGLVKVQHALEQVLNRTFDQARVQRVLFTDFVIQADE